jgi:hypothetical protein
LGITLSIYNSNSACAFSVEKVICRDYLTALRYFSNVLGENRIGGKVLIEQFSQLFKMKTGNACKTRLK